MADELERKLSGGLKKTASWARLKDDGSLEVETFDFSDDAQGSFGNDVAFLITVAPEHLPDLLGHLEWLGQYPGEAGQARLLDTVQQRFTSYFEFKKWLEQCGIPFRTKFDSQA
jgi:hypothetical protein